MKRFAGRRFRRENLFHLQHPGWLKASQPVRYFARDNVRHSVVATFRQNVVELAGVPALWRGTATSHFQSRKVSRTLTPSRVLALKFRLGFNEQNLRPVDPILPEINAEPAVAIFGMKAEGGPSPQFFEVVLCPCLPHVW